MNDIDRKMQQKVTNGFLTATIMTTFIACLFVYGIIFYTWEEANRSLQGAGICSILFLVFAVIAVLTHKQYKIGKEELEG
ncbi:hypothetical protein HN670_01345 [bacterium]|jgi:phosphatidylserine synthase|nr:hypothetical protein [bacterium]